LKRARTAIGQGDPQAAASLVQSASDTAARAASKGVIHRNAAARLSSRLQRALNKIRASA
jgi:small subunit ribosomal protein S20